MSSRSQFVTKPLLVKVQEPRPTAELKYALFQGKLTIPDICRELAFSAADLVDEGEIGRGAFGFVNRMLHKPTRHVMAVKFSPKRIRSTLNEREQNKTLKDLDVVMNSSTCSHIVKFYGALFEEGDCWICMEMMATALDKFYKLVYQYLSSVIPEAIIGKISVATISALSYLKTELKVIHRDVKPSNILIDRSGNIKLCDFGISGQLVDSIAKSHDAGCKPYMAPERIDPGLVSGGYDIRSDVWSFGITLIELSTGRFPYPEWSSIFEQLTCVLYSDPPELPMTEGPPERTSSDSGSSSSSTAALSIGTGGQASVRFSQEFRDFVAQCLKKDFKARPKYHALMSHPFYLRSYEDPVDVGAYFSTVLDRIPSDTTLKDLLGQENVY